MTDDYLDTLRLARSKVENNCRHSNESLYEAIMNTPEAQSLTDEDLEEIVERALYS